MELSKVTSGALKCEKVHFDMGQLCDEVSERYDAPLEMMLKILLTSQSVFSPPSAVWLLS